MRPPRKEFLLFAAKFAVIFGLLVTPWPGLARFFSGTFDQVADFLGHGLLSTDRFEVRLVSAPAGVIEGDWDCVVLVKNATSGATVDAASLDLHRVVYLPTVVFLALSLASPLRRRGIRPWLLLGGLALLPLLSLLPILSFLAQIRVLDLGTTLHSFVDIAYRALVTPPGMAYALPALLWGSLVALTAPAAPRLLQQPPPPTSESA